MIRAAAGVVLLLLAVVSLSGAWAWIAGIAAVVLLATSAMGSCPPYSLLGINTRKSE